jgi:hypothetical protein
VPEEHPACCAVAREVQSEILSGLRLGAESYETGEPKKDQRSEQEEALPSRTASFSCHAPSTQLLSKGLLNDWARRGSRGIPESVKPGHITEKTSENNRTALRPAAIVQPVA